MIFSCLEQEENERKRISCEKIGRLAALPRRVRFYHSKIDAGNLNAGDDYSVLRNVVVIFITTYDPFNLNRMIYTIKNGCVEEPGLSYEDGAMTIFLYTKGTEGEPAEDLRQLAVYMEHSTIENVKSAGLASLHEMVTKVKLDREVGLAYMKTFEIEKRIRAKERVESKVEDILDLLDDVGSVPDELEQQLRKQTDLELLRKWLKMAAHSKSIEEFKSRILE